MPNPITPQAAREQITRIRRLRRILDQEHELGLAIMSVPTGPSREQLTEANIHLMSACSKLREAEESLNKLATS